MNIQTGDRVKLVPVTFSAGVDARQGSAIPATVVYVHPERRYYVAAFDGTGIRESFIISPKKKNPPDGAGTPSGGTQGHGAIFFRQAASNRSPRPQDSTEEGKWQEEP